MANITELIEQVKAVTAQIEPLLKADVEDKKPEESPDITAKEQPAPEPEPVVDTPATEPSEPVPTDSPDVSQDVQPDTAEESEPEYEEIISVMSPEELDKLEAAIMKVKSSRQAPEAAPEAAPAPQAAPEQMEKMMKSMEAQMESLQKNVAQLTSELAKKNAPAKPVAANKPLAMNTKEVQVLEKSEQPPEMLSKSEVINHLRGEERKGNKFVDTALIFDAAHAITPEQLRKVYADAEKRGIKIPMKSK